MPPRFYTPAEADRSLPRIAGLLRGIQKDQESLHFVSEQVRDLEAMWAEEIHSPACRDHADYARYTRELASVAARIRDGFAEIAALGIEVKDVRSGLVDFYAVRGDVVVHLCWQLGEPAVAHWHTLSGGFAGRRPLEEF
ncbi:MAG: DUF2203 domain-containing protein [Methanobacteriota archaeon]